MKKISVLLVALMLVCSVPSYAQESGKNEDYSKMSQEDLIAKRDKITTQVREMYYGAAAGRMDPNTARLQQEAMKEVDAINYELGKRAEARIRESQEKYEKLIERSEKVQDKFVLQQERYDEILAKWEEQQKEYDKILKKWKKSK
jgi:hypothetical protein